MKRELIITPRATIHPNKICLYNSIEWRPAKPKRESISSMFCDMPRYVKNFKNSTRTANGLISPIAKKKIERALDYLLTISKDQQVQHTSTLKRVNFKICFITLTLPSKQIHSDNEIKSTCLNSFLLEIQKYYKVQNYLWRAEKQGNGNIHFHIITDKFIPWSEMRTRWNRITEKLGYVSRYRAELLKWHKEGFKVRKDLLKNWSYKNQIRAYESGKANDYNNPNSTDIHSVRKIGNIKAYISKYVTKNPLGITQLSDEEKNKILVKGRIWSSSQALSNITGSIIDIDSHTQAEIERIVKDSNIYKYEGDYFKVLYISYQDLMKFNAHDLFEYFTGYLYSQFHYSEQASLLN